MRLLPVLIASLILALGLPALADRVPIPPGPPPDWMIHLYREFDDGGLEEVQCGALVSEAGVQQLRVRMRREASGYAQGHYPVPDAHAATAVEKLRDDPAGVSVIYVAVRRGGEIRFRSEDAHLVGALHEWMAATVRLNQRLHPNGGPGEETGGDDD